MSASRSNTTQKSNTVDLIKSDNSLGSFSQNKKFGDLLSNSQVQKQAIPPKQPNPWTLPYHR